MLFNSYSFILLFLPATLSGYFLLARRAHWLAAGWLAAASLFFYALWSPLHALLLLGSICANFAFGVRLASLQASGEDRRANRLLAMAIAGNLLLLCYYKYTNFFLASIGTLTGAAFRVAEIALPLGISFFTFTQIAFLADARRGKAREFSFIHYCLFVTYFPHLIAGPILHHGEMMPQFRDRAAYHLKWENLAVGLTLFLIGLFKKTGIADNVADFARPAFDAAGAGSVLNPLDAWIAAFAYTLQIYFDFSGYSDMAIGLSRLFGIVLPVNFDSPYKATSMIDFWRRWHITLSRFLRDYLYIPLGGNRKGAMRRYLNLFLTMLLGGLWHGANWTFVCWGALHGIYLMSNHGWMALCKRLSFRPAALPGWPLFARLITFAAVIVAWIFFRAANVDAAVAMLKAMAGMAAPLPECSPTSWSSPDVAVTSACLGGHAIDVAWILALLVVCWAFPNTQEVLATYKPGLISPGYRGIVAGRSFLNWAWSPTFGWLVIVSGLGIFAMLSISQFSEFIYFIF